MKKRIMPLVAIFLFFHHYSYAAAFDCSSGSLNVTELKICNEPYLSGLDNMMDKLFSKARLNTLSVGFLINDQKEWIGKRDRCKSDYECIKNTYIDRNLLLSKVVAFKSVENSFGGSEFYVEPDKYHSKNKEGFLINSSQWPVKELSAVSDINTDAEEEIRFGKWELLNHLNVDNNIFFFFKVSKNDTFSYLVLISDFPGKSVVISKYDSKSYGYPEIRITDKTDNSFIYVVHDLYNEENDKREDKYYLIDFKGVKDIKSADVDNEWVNSRISEVTDKEQVTNILKKERGGIQLDDDWMGYCGEKLCRSNTLSPDGRWHVASGDYEGVYLFPKNRPDIGVNVFFNDKKYEATGFNYKSNFSWGKDDEFFFAIVGEGNGIWKTDINNKKTQNILSLYDVSKPYFFRYNNVDYVISFFDSDGYTESFIISKDVSE
ncbi:lysozyme inhibitor LprI family protein [Morganella morganii]|uniref:lysozyme inhibitor LprI family protein n=1 Tax=Morganella morganii TaxID=582 RepID=UPI00339C6717